MVKICLKILDVSNEHLRDPAEDVSARSDPKYVGRVISAMVGHTLYVLLRPPHRPFRCWHDVSDFRKLQNDNF